jgi:hypothetical protein
VPRPSGMLSSGACPAPASRGGPFWRQAGPVAVRGLLVNRPPGAWRFSRHDRDAKAGVRACPPATHRARVGWCQRHIVRKREMAPTIDEGTVVRDRKWSGKYTGTVVRRDGDSVFVAWHGLSCRGRTTRQRGRGLGRRAGRAARMARRCRRVRVSDGNHHCRAGGMIVAPRRRQSPGPTRLTLAASA